MELLKYLLISIPMVSAMTCGLIFIVVFPRSFSKLGNRIRQTLGVYYLLMVVLWFIINMEYNRMIGSLLIPVYVLLITWTQVIFYHFLCCIIPYKEKFKTFHYKVGLVIFVLSIIIVYILSNTRGITNLDTDYLFYQCMYAYSSITIGYYTLLSWDRLFKSHKEHYKEFGTKNTKFTWISYLLVIRTLLAILFVVNNGRIAYLDILIVTLIALQHIMVTFNVLQQNLINRVTLNDKKKLMLSSGQIVTIDKFGKMEDVALETNSVIDVRTNTIFTEDDIIDYFTKEKPYLQKDFKLDDLVKHFEINRTYISKFINITFHCNVSQYINSWRLKEVRSLQASEPTTSIEDIAIQAGFSNYRHYLRAKDAFEQH